MAHVTAVFPQRCHNNQPTEGLLLLLLLNSLLRGRFESVSMLKPTKGDGKKPPFLSQLMMKKRLWIQI